MIKPDANSWSGTTVYNEPILHDQPTFDKSSSIIFKSGDKWIRQYRYGFAVPTFFCYPEVYNTYW